MQIPRIVPFGLEGSSAVCVLQEYRGTYGIDMVGVSWQGNLRT